VEDELGWITWVSLIATGVGFISGPPLFEWLQTRAQTDETQRADSSPHPPIAAQPRPERTPQPQSPPPAQAQTGLKGDLEQATYEGNQLMAGIPDRFGMTTLLRHTLGGHVTTLSDVNRWQAHVETLLAKEPMKRDAFLYDPPPPPQTGSALAIQASLLDPTTALRNRMVRRLRQFRLVIDGM
jgi:hypothetical protein